MKNIHIGITGMLKTFIFAFIPILFTPQSFAETLSLDQYLIQVQTGNDSIKASTATSEAAPNKMADAELIYAPTVFGSAQTAIDKKELVPSSQRGSETDYTNLQMGVSKMTKMGTTAKLTYSASQTNIKDTSALYVPEPKYNEAAPTLEVSHPLWKNSNGKDLAKSIELQEGQAKITQLAESLKRKVTLSEAEGIYWRLVLSRESVRVSRENLDRAKKITDWNRKRVINELADNADLIQAEALTEVRQIELTMALDEERAAAHALNTARGQSSPGVKEDLIKITPELIAKLPVPHKASEREDVKASVEAEKLSEMGADLASAKYDPSLDVFATGTLNGRNVDSVTNAMTDSFKAKHPTIVLGVKFSAPLGGETISRMRSGYAKDREAAVYTLARKRYENDREWLDLTRKLDESKSRLSLTQQIETTQLRKLSAERALQSRGRSTMFQVMQSETDYASAQLNVIKNKAEILGIIARMKTFGGEG